MSFLDVEWIPGSEDRLLTWGSQIKLYRLEEDEKRGNDYEEEEDSLKVELEREILEPPHYIKCLSPVVQSGGEIRVAVGQVNGRISLLSFTSETRKNNVVSELGKPSGGARQCQSLAWNGQSLLAAGYDKNRNDPAILVFDPSSHPSHSLGQEQVRASLEMGYGESCGSLTWMHPFGETLICGINGKCLRIVDIRQDSNRAVRASTSTRAVYGVTVDPFLDCRIASHVDNQVVIWDTRNFDKPIVTHSQNRKVTKIAWSPTRMGLLCSITDNANSLLLHDIQSWAVMTEDGEPAVTERKISLSDSSISNELVSAFVWHPASENTLISVSNTGHLRRTVVSERISPSWSARHSLCWPQSGILRIYDSSSELFSEIGDISHVMQVRASRGYGPRLKDNIRIVEDDFALSSVWKWIDETQILVENDVGLKEAFAQRSCPGVRTALGLNVENRMGLLNTVSEQRSWYGVSSISSRKFFRSEAREKAIKLSGWASGSGYDKDELYEFTDKLEKDGEYARAAAIAMFSLDLRLSLNILQRGASFHQLKDRERANSMRMVSMALSGYTEDKSGLWHEMVSSTDSSVTEPYLRILFAFLMCPCEDYKTILNSELLIADKVAFACAYLPDDQLQSYVDLTWQSLKEKGDLMGLILSGMCSSETIELLQRYLDITGDIQTVSWMTSLGLQKELILDSPRPQVWINCFRNLLNMWSLWSARAEFDISVNVIIKKPLQQVYVSCNYCGRCIGQHVKTGIPKPPSFIQKQQQQLLKSNGRIQSCPSCRKPLPRCSVCLINMGTMSGLNIRAEAPNRESEKKVNSFRNFFSWCQTCRHGGHALHILDWFKDHAECPVSGCSCKCSVLDGGLLSSNKIIKESEDTNCD